jgi:hypothetical protein
MIVGLSGFARSGKDTASEILINEYGFKRMAFADALKADLKGMIETALETIGKDVSLYTDMLSTSKETVRPIMVEYGRIMRALYAPYWIDRLFSDMIGTGQNRFVITDCRYENEAKEIRKFGGIVIGITRPNVLPANAEEEMSFSKFSPDYTVVNDADIKVLHDRVFECVFSRFGRKLCDEVTL